MLTRLFIADFAIVSKLELNIEPGMTALTGETGAGKSILIQALGLTLGDRSDPDMVRSGKDKCEISAWFHIDEKSAAHHWLQVHDLDSAQECQLRRILLREGRSRAYINNRPVPVLALKELGNFLVDIHSQHEHQSLLQRDHQRTMLDEFGNHHQLLEQVQMIAQHHQTLLNQLRKLDAAATDGKNHLELLKYQLDEFKNFAFEQHEYQLLNQEHHQLSHTEQLLSTCQAALDALYDADENSINTNLRRSIQGLEQVQDYDPNLGSITELLGSALIQAEEATTELRHYTETVQQDPQRFAHIEKRLEQMLDIARKHHIKPQNLYEHGLALERQLVELSVQQSRVAELREEKEQLMQEFQGVAKKLSKQRAMAAQKLCDKVTPIIHSLGMPGAHLTIDIEEVPTSTPTPSGTDRITIKVSTNPGSPVKPLHKIASGGELSRIGLAIQVVAIDQQAPGTFVFDEVDSGVGGAVAEIVGKQLNQLSSKRQILCITHLPQVAVHAHHQLRIAKSQKAEQTETQIVTLGTKERTEEIARMLGGEKITEQTRKHAQELLTQAQSPKYGRIRKSSTVKKKAG